MPDSRSASSVARIVYGIRHPRRRAIEQSSIDLNLPSADLQQRARALLAATRAVLTCAETDASRSTQPSCDDGAAVRNSKQAKYGWGPTSAPVRSRKAAGRAADEIVVLLVAATALGHWMSDLPSGSFWGLWVLLYGAAVARLVQRFGSQWLTWTLTHQPALSVLLAWAFASCLWSLDPAITLRRAASLLGTTLLGVFIGYSCPPPRLMRALFWMFVLLIVASIGVGLVLPTPVGKGIPVGWRGIMTHKNSLGAAALLATIYFLVMTLSGHIRPLWERCWARHPSSRLCRHGPVRRSWLWYSPWSYRPTWRSDGPRIAPAERCCGACPSR
jgi:hypothetical protein